MQAGCRMLYRLSRALYSSEAAEKSPIVFKVDKPVPLIYPWMKNWKPLELVPPFEAPAQEEDDEEEEILHIGRGRKPRVRLADMKKRQSQQMPVVGILDMEGDLPVDSADEADYLELARIVDEEDRGCAEELSEDEQDNEEEERPVKKQTRKMVLHEEQPRKDECEVSRLRDIIDEIEDEEMKLDSKTYGSLLQWCGNARSLELGERLVEHMNKTRHPLDRYMRNMLVEMYGKCGAMEHARQAFEGIRNKNVFSWTIMVTAYAQNGQSRESLQVLGLMDLEGERPNNVTFVNALAACANLKALNQGRMLHQDMKPYGYDEDMIAETALLNMYSKCSSLGDAKLVFNRMRRKDLVSYNAMISALSRLSYGKEALEFFRMMDQEGIKPDEVTYGSVLNACEKLGAIEYGKIIHERTGGTRYGSDVVVGTALVSMYGKCGELDVARRVFAGLQRKNVVTWTAMISACVQNGRPNEAMEFFRAMDVPPDEVTMTGVLQACGRVEDGWRIFSSMKKGYSLAPSAEHYGCMVELLSREGKLKEAEDVIEKIPSNARYIPWMNLFSACRRLGDFELGVSYGKNVLGIDPTSYSVRAALADMYDAIGRHKDAEVLKNVPRNVTREARSWIEIRNRVYEIECSRTYSDLPKKLQLQVPKLLGKFRTDTDIHTGCLHSEKVAVGLGLVSNTSGSVLRVVKNQRACYDCHMFIKCVSKVVGRKICLRDSVRYHHFEDGSCSCGDLW